MLRKHSNMGYLAAWKVLDEMIADFRKRGLAVPDKIMNDLKSARTVLNVIKDPQGSGEALGEIDGYLATVEAYLISEGEKQFGKDYADEWLERLDKSSRKPSEEETEEERFIPGLPREQKWIRVKPSADLPLEELNAIAKQSNVSIKIQSDSHFLVYGTDEQVKDFVKNMTTKHGSKPRK